MQISENKRIRLLSLAQKSGQAWCKELLLVKIQGILSEHPDNKNYGVRRMQTVLHNTALTSALERYTVL